MALTQEGRIDGIEWQYFAFAANGALTLFAYPLILLSKSFSGFDVSLWSYQIPTVHY